MVNKDYPAVKIAAHSLKPQLSYMGVKEDASNIFPDRNNQQGHLHILKLYLH